MAELNTKIVSKETKTESKDLNKHFIIVALIALLLLIPQFFVDLVLSERQHFESMVQDEIMGSWAYEQTMLPPLLSIMTDNSYTQNGDIETEALFFAPESSEISVVLNNEIRQKGLYEASVYTADVKMKGVFNLENLFEELTTRTNVVNVYKGSVLLNLFVSDLKGMVSIDKVLLNGHEGKVQLGNSDTSFEVISVPVVQGDNKIKFELDFKIRGSQSFNLIPFGQKLDFTIEGNNATPSFAGKFLPEKRDVGENSFSATYSQSFVSSGLPSVFADRAIRNDAHNTGYVIDVSAKSTEYVLIDRLMKYALLFITVTFVSVFCLEIVYKNILSFMQFIVIGVALILFYLLLISISEHAGFVVAYVISALLLSSMIGLYIKAIFGSYKIGFVIGAVLLSTYSVLFAVIHMDTYALLFGTLLLTLLMGVVMFITRNLSQKG